MNNQEANAIKQVRLDYLNQQVSKLDAENTLTTKAIADLGDLQASLSQQISNQLNGLSDVRTARDMERAVLVSFLNFVLN